MYTVGRHGGYCIWETLAGGCRISRPTWEWMLGSLWQVYGTSHMAMCLGNMVEVAYWHGSGLARGYGVLTLYLRSTVLELSVSRHSRLRSPAFRLPMSRRARRQVSHTRCTGSRGVHSSMCPGSGRMRYRPEACAENLMRLQSCR